MSAGMLPYGEVHVLPGEIIITHRLRRHRRPDARGVESLPHLIPAQRSLCEQAVEASGVEPESVLVVRITEVGIEVDAIDTDDARWPVRTKRLEPAFTA
ncbi:MAG: hypothetical protein ABWX62_04450 [Microterricola sp.]